MDNTVKPEQIFADIMDCSCNDEISRLSGGQKIDYRKLRVFLFQSAKRAIQDLHPDWIEGETLQRGSFDRLCEINILNDIRENLAGLIEEFVANIGVEPIAALNAAPLFDSTAVASTITRPIDEKKYKGGFTELHEAVKAGNLQEVKRLVEEEKARLDIKDNSGRTPYFYAIGYQHNDIIEYLSSFQ